MLEAGTAKTKIERTAPPPSDERSIDNHRFFFACIEIAFNAWPEDHVFPPANARDHLRAWLLCHDAVMHCETIDLAGVKSQGEAEQAGAFFAGVMGQARAAGGHSVLWFDDEGRMSLRIPRTIRMHKNEGITRSQFKAVLERVLTAIYRETGLEVEAVKKEARRAVAPVGFGSR